MLLGPARAWDLSPSSGGYRTPLSPGWVLCLSVGVPMSPSVAREVSPLCQRSPDLPAPGIWCLGAAKHIWVPNLPWEPGLSRGLNYCLGIDQVMGENFFMS